MNPLIAKYGKEAAALIVKEAKDFAVKHYSNPLSRKFAEWAYIAQEKAQARRELKEDQLDRTGGA